MKNVNIFFKQIIEGYFISQGHQLTSQSHYSMFLLLKLSIVLNYLQTYLSTFLSIRNLDNTLNK